MYLYLYLPLKPGIDDTTLASSSTAVYGPPLALGATLLSNHCSDTSPPQTCNPPRGSESRKYVEVKFDIKEKRNEQRIEHV